MGYGSLWRLRQVSPVAPAAATVRRARGADRRAVTLVRCFVIGPAVVGALAGIALGKSYGWLPGAIGAYATVGLAQLLTFLWLLVWTRPSGRSDRPTS
jgi:hypothetical protein